MNPQHTLFVCTTCASVWRDGKRQGTSGGEQLLDRLSHLAKTWHLRDDFPIQPVECMSACSHSCTVSFSAPGKYTYLFGDLPASAETLPEISTAVIQCASQYFAKPDGLLPWSERPERLKKGILAKIPPIPTH